MLSRSLNGFNNHQDYHGFVIERRAPQVNHLSFADDTILFTLGRVKSFKLIMPILRTYEDTSGLLINSDKCHFMVHQGVLTLQNSGLKG